MSAASSDVALNDGPLAIICGGGVLPFVVADAAIKRGRRVVLFPLRGFADAARVAAYPHHWAYIGQVARFMRIARDEHCRDVVFIGDVVRPAIWQTRPDFGSLRLLPRVIKLFRGGDNHLLSGMGRILEEDGFRLVGAHEVAPEILMPHGLVAGREPSDRERMDIARGLALLAATGPFDIGQAVVVADNRVLAIEAAEGTDRMLARVAELRRDRRIRTPVGTGVLVKAPKPHQDQRVDLPTIGPKTVEGVAQAGLAGIAVVAGSSIVAESERIAAAAAGAGIFLVGVSADGTGQ
jgi:hypothetical protein